jgi:hypothetical protein
VTCLRGGFLFFFFVGFVYFSHITRAKYAWLCGSIGGVDNLLLRCVCVCVAVSLCYRVVCLCVCLFVCSFIVLNYCILTID